MTGMDAEDLTVRGAESNGDGPGIPERPCAGCAAANAAAETADTRAALWKGVALGSFIAAGLVVAVCVVLARLGRAAVDGDEGDGE